MSGCVNCSSQAGCGEPIAERPGSTWRAPRRQVPLDGILNVDKPPGITSHDVVDAIRRVAGQRKVGHTGTLDPMATGVLVVCLGQATRLAEYLTAGTKRYRASVLLGTETDTYDLDGRVVAGGGRTDFSTDEIRAALATYRGEIAQVPPMHSAIKQDGQPLYRLARQGKTVEREARAVEVYELDIMDWAPPVLTIELACSPGTYVRSLAHDLGQSLGCGGTLATLVRLASGRFSLETAVSLGRLEEAFEHGQEERYLLAMDEALLEWPAIILGANETSLVRNGQGVARSAPEIAGGQPGGEPALARAYSPDGDFVAVVRHDEATGLWRPKKVFQARSESDPG